MFFERSDVEEMYGKLRECVCSRVDGNEREE
jgi:hypothetical protein